MRIEECRRQTARYIFSHCEYNVEGFAVGNLKCMCRLINISYSAVCSQLARNEVALIDGWSIYSENEKDIYNVLKKANVPVNMWERKFNVHIPGIKKAYDSNDKNFVSLIEQLKNLGRK